MHQERIRQIARQGNGRTAMVGNEAANQRREAEVGMGDPGLQAGPFNAGLSGPELHNGKKVQAVRRRGLLATGAACYRRLLVGLDLIALGASVITGLLVGNATGRPGADSAILLAALIGAPLWVTFAYANDLYHEFERRVNRDLLTDLGRLTFVSTAWIWLFVLVRAWLESAPTDLLTASIIWLSMLVLVPIGRSTSRGIADKTGWTVQRAVIIGDTSGIVALSERVDRHPEWRLKLKLAIKLVVFPENEGNTGVYGPTGTAVVGVLLGSDDSGFDSPTLVGAEEIIGAMEEVHASRVLIAGGFNGYRDLAQRTAFIHAMLDRGFAVDIVAGGPETLYSRALAHDYEGIPILSLKPAVRRRLSLAFKRLTDVALSLAGLILFSPIMVWAAIRIKLDSGGSVFFRQLRWGLNDKDFELVKFRTMYEGSHEKRDELREATRESGNDDVLFKLEDDPRVTPIGKKLRRWSIDELPQLWNVLKGDMSMVGPRPLVPEEAAEAEEAFAARSSVKPGVAGPWQALGRSSIPFEDMIRLDYSYVMSGSTSEDLRLLLKTVGAVLGRRGAM